MQQDTLQKRYLEQCQGLRRQRSASGSSASTRECNLDDFNDTASRSASSQASNPVNPLASHRSTKSAQAHPPATLDGQSVRREPESANHSNAPAIQTARDLLDELTNTANTDSNKYDFAVNSRATTPGNMSFSNGSGQSLPKSLLQRVERSRAGNWSLPPTCESGLLLDQQLGGLSGAGGVGATSGNAERPPGKERACVPGMVLATPSFLATGPDHVSSSPRSRRDDSPPSASRSSSVLPTSAESTSCSSSSRSSGQQSAASPAVRIFPVNTPPTRSFTPRSSRSPRKAQQATPVRRKRLLAAGKARLHESTIGTRSARV